VRLTRPFAVLLAVAAVLGGAVAVTAAAQPAAPTAARGSGGATVPVERLTLVCPGAVTRADVQQAYVTAISPEGGDGTLRVEALGAAPDAKPLLAAPASRPDGPVTLRYPVPAAGPSTLVVQATGALARGLTADVSVRASAGAARGRSNVSCTAPQPDAWFVGGGATVGRRSALYLSNTDATAATVDVTVFTPTGAQQPAAAQGLLVPAGQQRVLALDALVPGTAATAVAVSSVSGRVASALADVVVNGLDPGGVDWVPPSVEPARSLVIPGVPGDADAKSVLQLVAPGPGDAVVHLRLLTGEGSIVPLGIDTLQVPAGQLVEVPLDKVKPQGGYAIEADADQPMVGGVRTVRAGQYPDFAYTAAAAALPGAAAVTDVEASVRVSTVLLLTAPGDTDVSATLTTLPPAGSKPPAVPKPVTVKVPAGRTTVVQLGVSGYRVAAVVTPAAGAGPLYVAWLTTEQGPRGPLITGGPVVASPATMRVPAVLPDPMAGLGAGSATG